MAAKIRYVGYGLLALAGCLEAFELPASDEAAERTEPDAGRGDAVTVDGRLCTSDAQCEPGQTCCPSGLLGRCVDLALVGRCPAPDLGIVTTEATLGLARRERYFDPESSTADACALEKGCLGAAGYRQLLLFSIELENQGDADLLLGIPGATSAFQTAVCDGQPYFPNYISYQLRGIDGVPIVGAEGRAQARCQQLPDGFRARFSCEFWGLWRGFSESFAPDLSLDATRADCQWVDITDVPAGDYALRVSVDPSGALMDPTRGNQKDFPVRLPILDDPLQSCPADLENGTESNGGSALLGTGTRRECGWSRISTEPASCTPGTSLTIGCTGCDTIQGDAMLRICEGRGSCSFAHALANGNDTSRLYRYDNPAAFIELADDECERRAQADTALTCNPTSTCPTVTFTCPPSGAYSVLRASALPNIPVSCAGTSTL